MTEIYDYLRLLFARIGDPHCYICKKPITSQTLDQIVDQIMGLSQGTRLSILAPVVRRRKGEYKAKLEELRKDGFVRVNIDGKTYDLDEEIVLDKFKPHDIDVYVDRVIIKPGIRSRVADSVETALRLTDGICKVVLADGREIMTSEHFACIECGVSFPELSPRMFSFNNPYGACSRCGGMGELMDFDPELVISDPGLSLSEGVIEPWKNREFYLSQLSHLQDYLGFDLSTPWRELSSSVREKILYGFREVGFEGVIPSLERRFREYERRRREQGEIGKGIFIGDEFFRYMRSSVCEVCKGARLRPESLHVMISGKNIWQVTEMSIADCSRFFSGLRLTERKRRIASRVLKEIQSRLYFLIEVGLDYLTLSRLAGTLSGGESQRIRLATQIGSSLVGVIYALDEPSIGLHQRDNIRLIQMLQRLRDMGNTVIVVEHDKEMILSSDYIIDMGPGAGKHGGYVVATGSPQKIAECKDSLTGRYLSGACQIPLPRKRRGLNSQFITVKGARANNLKNITVRFPLGVFTCITGVSGSGKSTLVIDIMLKALRQKLYYSKEKPGEFDSIEGEYFIDKVIHVDQSPIGRSLRSNPATYTGVFTYIRELFSLLSEARARGYKPGRFSFNVKGGRCEACQGDGLIKIEMHFLPDIYIQCEVCKGRRYNRETLEIRYKGKNIADILEMTVYESYQFFENIPRIRSKLKTLIDVGLGYITLGQSATTLSGGEAQRIKLSRELSKRATGKTLYFLDEPTTGLHFADIQKLLEVLNRLVQQGNTVIVIEHNMDVIKNADWIIDLGPEGGEKGGEVVVCGTPEEVAQSEISYTGKYLRSSLALQSKA
jgi:excinuclease ABC subunit A